MPSEYQLLLPARRQILIHAIITIKTFLHHTGTTGITQAIHHTTNHFCQIFPHIQQPDTGNSQQYTAASRWQYFPLYLTYQNRNA
jgi:hypothetical protein